MFCIIRLIDRLKYIIRCDQLFTNASSVQHHFLQKIHFFTSSATFLIDHRTNKEQSSQSVTPIFPITTFHYSFQTIQSTDTLYYHEVHKDESFKSYPSLASSLAKCVRFPTESPVHFERCRRAIQGPKRSRNLFLNRGHQEDKRRSCSSCSFHNIVGNPRRLSWYERNGRFHPQRHAPDK